MLDLITGSDITAEVIMTRVAFAGAVVIVEGDDDVSLFERLFARGSCEVLPARGKENALDSIQRLNNSKVPGVLAIVDADFDRIAGLSSSYQNVVMSDHHDVEVMLITSPALEAVLQEYASRGKADRYLHATKSQSLREALFASAHPIGVFRWLSYSQKWSLDFDEMNYKKFLNDNLSVDCDKMISYIRQFTAGRYASDPTSLAARWPDDAVLVPMIAKTMETTRSNRNELCCGHDLAALLAIGLRSKWGSQPASIANKSNVGALLRLAYDTSFFATTDLYSTICDWEQMNKPYNVLGRS
ncbi:hypothetical protein ES708_04741 [subsurface metagenome]